MIRRLAVPVTAICVALTLGGGLSASASPLRDTSSPAAPTAESAAKESDAPARAQLFVSRQTFENGAQANAFTEDFLFQLSCTGPKDREEIPLLFRGSELISKIPYLAPGLTCSIRESDDNWHRDGYTVNTTIEPATFVIPQADGVRPEITIRSHYAKKAPMQPDEPGKPDTPMDRSISITKHVTGDAASIAQGPFTFDYSCTGEGSTPTKGSIKVLPEHTETITGLPAGRCTITETADDFVDVIRVTSFKYREGDAVFWKDTNSVDLDLQNNRSIDLTVYNMYTREAEAPEKKGPESPTPMTTPEADTSQPRKAPDTAKKAGDTKHAHTASAPTPGASSTRRQGTSALAKTGANTASIAAVTALAGIAGASVLLLKRRARP